MNILGQIPAYVPFLIVAGAIGIPVLVYALLGMGERILEKLPPQLGRRAQPWLWLGLPILLVLVILVYPIVMTLGTSTLDARSEAWVGFDNYRWVFSGSVLGVVGNNILWLIVYPAITLMMALIASVLFDKVRYEPVAMSIVLLPTAISFTAGAVIWGDIYSYQASGSPQIGLLNAIIGVFGIDPVAWLIQPVINNLALIFIAVWLHVGVATLILSAAIKGVGSDMVEAARLDGAGEFRILLSIILPNILPAILVVLTTTLIASLKVFDIVYVMTNGNFGTDVIGNLLYYELFQVSNFGHASAMAVVLLFAALPVALINVFQFRKEER